MKICPIMSIHAVTWGGLFIDCQLTECMWFDKCSECLNSTTVDRLLSEKAKEKERREDG